MGLDEVKHLAQTCLAWGRKNKSACYLSGYHPTQSYLLQPHPTLASSTSLGVVSVEAYLIQPHPTLAASTSLPCPDILQCLIKKLKLLPKRKLTPPYTQDVRLYTLTYTFVKATGRHQHKLKAFVGVIQQLSEMLAWLNATFKEYNPEHLLDNQAVDLAQKNSELN